MLDLSIIRPKIAGVSPRKTVSTCTRLVRGGQSNQDDKPGARAERAGSGGGANEVAGRVPSGVPAGEWRGARGTVAEREGRGVRGARVVPGARSGRPESVLAVLYSLGVPSLGGGACTRLPVRSLLGLWYSAL